MMGACGFKNLWCVLGGFLAIKILEYMKIDGPEETWIFKAYLIILTTDVIKNESK